MADNHRPGLIGMTGRWTLVWRRNFYIYRKRWRTYIIPPLIEPFLMIFALGVGVGYFIKDIAGIPYLTYVAAGLVASEALLRSTFECTYGSFWRLRFQNTFEAIVSTPVSASEVALGEIAWGATRSLLSTFVVIAVLAALGVFTGLGILFVPFIVALGAVNFASMALLVSSRIPDLEYFNFYFAGVVFPTMFLAGTYFPLDRLPDLVQTLVWAIPYTSVVDVIRGLIVGKADPHLWLKLGYIAATTVVIAELAIRSLARRIVT